ncbi:enoyl-CoA hydratase-related protein [Streptomyces sp. NPDC006527]|uniref:enoyl-CoA hydratase-related protein n=1 Tax=Streptomyces sp. NPDC006527 TaxID=3364749 RepID=UPI00369488E1
MAAAEAAALMDRREDGVAVITLNRPRALNAVNAELSAAVGEALEAAEADDTVRAVVVTGAGRAFCAGADLKEIAAGRSVHDPRRPEWGFAGLVRHEVAKPLIAAVNGPAMGGGMEIVLACDLAVIDEAAVLGLPEVARGLFAGAGGAIRLARQIPVKAAMEVLLTGRTIAPDEALAMGLVNYVARAGTAVETALGLAAVIAGNAPLGVRTVKRLVRESTDATSEDALWRHNDAAWQQVVASEDAEEGARAFAEKRLPAWRGR